MNSLILSTEGEEIHLQGAGICTPVRGARRVESAALEEGWREVVEVYLEGLPGAVSALRAQIERLLAGGEARARIEAYPGAELVEARLAGGTCKTLAWNSGGGTAALRLELIRSEPWQGAEVELPLSSPGGEGVTGGITIYAHSDSEHWNYADIRADNVRGDRPGMLRLELENASLSESLGEMIVSLDAGENACQPGRFLEAENANGGSREVQAGCSGGAARRVEAGSTAAALLTWQIEGSVLARLGGRETCPAVRFASLPPEETVWVWWQVRAGEALVWETARELLRGETLQALPALPLPPVRLGSPAGLALELCAKTSGGAADLNLDFVQLCPLDGRRQYRGAAALPPGGILVDDGFERRVYARSTAGEWSSYAARGGSLRLRPEREQRLYLLHDGSVDAPVRVRMWHRPAWGSV